MAAAGTAFRSRFNELPPPALVEVKACEDALGFYTRKAWALIEPVTRYLHNWHIDCISEHLEACNLGQIRRLIINIPPRGMKSTLVSVMWPTWTWAKAEQRGAYYGPGTRFLCTSYGDLLSTKHSRQRREIIRSAWYRTRWPQVQLARDQDQKLRFESTRTGFMMATSMHGAFTGEGGDIIILDDPHKSRIADGKIMEVETDVERRSVLASWDTGWSTRLNDKKRGVYVIVMQRLHDQDLCGHLLEKEDGKDWTVLALPVEAPTRTVVPFPISGHDYSRPAGELLWEAREGRAELATARAALGSRGYEAQYNQHPAPPGGGIFEIAWWRPYREVPPKFDMLIMSLDTAFKEKEENDFSACVIAGVLAMRIYILYSTKVKCGFPELKRMLASWWLSYNRPAAVLVEDAASGQSLIQEFSVPVKLETLKLEGFNGELREDERQHGIFIPVLAIPALGDKVARAEAAAPMVEAGQVYVPDPSFIADASWMGDGVSAGFLKDTRTFPKGDGRDLVDALSQLLNYLRSGTYYGFRQYYEARAEIVARRNQTICYRCQQPIVEGVSFSREPAGAFHWPSCPPPVHTNGSVNGKV